MLGINIVFYLFHILLIHLSHKKVPHFFQLIQSFYVGHPGTGIFFSVLPWPYSLLLQTFLWIFDLFLPFFAGTYPFIQLNNTYSHYINININVIKFLPLKSLSCKINFYFFGTVRLTGVEKFSIFHSEKSLIFTCWNQYFIFVNYCSFSKQRHIKSEIFQ